MAQVSLTFESVFPNFVWWKKVLTDYKISETYINENDFNVLCGLAKGYLLKSTIVEQVYVTSAILWGAYYQNYLTKKEFYTRTIDDLTNLEQKVTQALYQVAQDSSVKFGDVIDETKLKGYLAALSTNTNTSDLQYLPQITQLKNYYNSLNSDSPALDMFQAFLKNLLLNLTENNFNNFPILYITWKNENNKNTNLLNSLDNNNKPIINVADAVNDNDAVNLKQLKAKHGSDIWKTTTDSRTLIIHPTDIDMQKKKIINLSDGVNDDNAVNYKQLQTTNNNVTINTKVGLLNSKNIAQNKGNITPLQSGFNTKLENSSIKYITNIKNDATKAKVDFIVSGQNLILRDTPQPKGAIDLRSNTTGFFNTELKNILKLTDTSYKFIWNLEIHHQNNEDFIRIWPNTNIIFYHANGVDIEKKGGSFIINNVNAVWRLKKASDTNNKKIITQAHMWYDGNNFQIFFIDINGEVLWLANWLKNKQVIIKQNNLIYEEI